MMTILTRIKNNIYSTTAKDALFYSTFSKSQRFKFKIKRSETKWAYFKDL